MIYCDTKKLLILQYLLNNNHESFDTMLIKFFGGFRGWSGAIPYTNTEVITPKPSKTSSIYSILCRKMHLNYQAVIW